MARSLFRLVLVAILIGQCFTQDQSGPPTTDTSVQSGTNSPPSRPDEGLAGRPSDTGGGDRRESSGGGSPPGRGGPPGERGSPGEGGGQQGAGRPEGQGKGQGQGPGQGGGGPGGGQGGGPGGPGGPGGGHGGPPGAGVGHEGPFMYKPSFSIAAGASVLYIIISAITTAQVFKYRTWYFMLFPQAAMGHLAGSVVRLLVIMRPRGLDMAALFMAQMIAWQLPPSLLGIVGIFTGTRVVWWVTPNERRTRAVLGVPPHAISICWSAAFVVPDMVKGTLGNFARPKEGERPNPASIFNRVQSICWVVQFFVFVCWSLWILWFMIRSRAWPIPVDAVEKQWRQLGWATFTFGVLLSWRILYGTLEFDAMYDPQSFVSTHEWMLWVGNHLPLILIYILFIIYHPGKYLPRAYTRFKFDTKKLEKEKREDPTPVAISNTSTREEPKGFEVTTAEIAPDPRGR